MNKFIQNRGVFLKELIKNPLVTGSSIVFIGSFIANIFNYFFNLSMGRLLTVSDYGLLTTLSSLFVLLGVFQVAFSNLFAKFTAKFETSKDVDGTRSLIYEGGKIVLIFSLATLVILLISTPLLAQFLHIENNSIILLISVAIFFSLLTSIPIGFFQGKLRFFLVSAINILQPFTKFIFGLLFVYFGYQIFGVVIAILLAIILTILFSYAMLYKSVGKKIKPLKQKPELKKEFIKFSYSYVLAGLGIAILTNSDIVLVRHFFTPEGSGQYAALSLMGKAVFYLTMPINFVFFPLIAQKKERKEKLSSTLWLGIVGVTVVSLVASSIYFLQPDLVLKIFFPSPQFSILKPYLGLFSIYILVFSLCTLMNSFFLSIGKTSVYRLTLLAGITQIILISLFHNSLFEIIITLLASVVLLLSCFTIYYIKNGRD